MLMGCRSRNSIGFARRCTRIRRTRRRRSRSRPCVDFSGVSELWYAFTQHLVQSTRLKVFFVSTIAASSAQLQRKTEREHPAFG